MQLASKELAVSVDVDVLELDTVAYGVDVWVDSVESVV